MVLAVLSALMEQRIALCSQALASAAKVCASLEQCPCCVLEIGFEHLVPAEGNDQARCHAEQAPDAPHRYSAGRQR
jgi:hypothetical protein